MQIASKILSLHAVNILLERENLSTYRRNQSNY
jgi:hypothetical protein